MMRKTRAGRQDDKRAISQGSRMPSIRAERWLPIICFLVSVICICLPAAMLMPAGAGTDEPNHIARVDQLASGIVMSQKVGTGKAGYHAPHQQAARGPLYGGAVDRSLMKQAQVGQYGFRESRSYSFPTWRDPRANAGLHYGTATTRVSFSNTAINSPIVYMPHTAAFRFARLFTSDAYWLIVAMRLGGVLLYCLVGVLALSLLPWGRWIFVAVLASPGSLLIASTVTADLMTLCCMVLLTALTVRTCVTGTLRAQDVVWYAISAITLSGVKMIYITGLAFVLLPLLLKKLRTRRNVIVLGSASAASAGLFFAWYGKIHSVNTSLGTVMQTDPQAQMHFLVSRPIGTLYRILSQSLFHSNMFATSEIGPFSLHQPTVTMLVTPATVTVIMIAAACIFEAAQLPPEIHLRRTTCGVMLGVVVISSILLATAEYLQWTVVGSRTITGVMDRYFLPFVPCLLISLIWLFSLRPDAVASKQNSYIDENNVGVAKSISKVSIGRLTGLAVCVVLMDIDAVLVIASLFAAV